MKDQFIDKYLELLNTEFKGLNLTRIENRDDFRIKQYEDSVIPLTLSKFYRNDIESTKFHVDIGFGGGFPVLPIANEIKGISSVGFEARAKKSKAVNSIAKTMDLNVKTFHERIENVLIDFPCVITFKAVSRVRQCLDYLKLSADAKIYFYKGPDLYASEGDDLNIDKSRFEIFEKINFKLEDGSERNFVGVKLKNVPRGTAKKNKKEHKNLVILSSFL